MKNITLLISFFLITASHLEAQNIQIYNRDGSANITNDTIFFSDTVSTTVAEGDFSYKNFAKIHNNTTDTVTIRLRRIEQQIIQGSEDYLCWGITCFGRKAAGSEPDWDVSDQAVVNPGDTAGGLGLIVYLNPNDNPGEAIYEYRFYDAANPNSNASVFVSWTITLLTNVNEIYQAAQKISVYPNPARDQFTVDLNSRIKADNQEIIVRNMLGKLVQRHTLSSGQERVNFSTDNMSGGIYFVSYALDGEVFKTSKLVVR